MPNLNMRGPFELTNESIDKNVKDSTHGNYALGKQNEKGGLTVLYVGRADNGLKRRLKEHVAESYTHFKYSNCSTEREAFNEECRNWHEWGEDKKLDNKIHPRRPDGKTYPCRYCKEFDGEN